MPHSHAHGHSHGHGHDHAPELELNTGEADLWTKWGILGEFSDSCLDVTIYLIGFITIIDRLINSLDMDDDFKTSPTFKFVVTGVSLLVALGFSGGAAYCHGIINKQFQDTPEEICEEGRAETSEAIHVIDSNHVAHDANESSHDYTALTTEETHEETTPVVNHNRARKTYELTRTQKFFIYGDGACHAIGRAGSYMAGAQYIMGFFNPGNLTSAKFNLITQCVSTLFGASFAYPEMRTCRNSLRQNNKNIAEKEERLARRQR